MVRLFFQDLHPVDSVRFVRVKERDVRPVVVNQQVNDGLHLRSIRLNGTREVLEFRLIAELRAGRGKTDERNLEDFEKRSDMHSFVAVPGSDHPDNRTGMVVARLLRRVPSSAQDEILHCAIQGSRLAGTRIVGLHAKGDVG